MRLALLALVLLLAACAEDGRPADPGADGLTFVDERLDDDTWRVRFRTGPEHDGFLLFPFMSHSLDLAEAAGKAWLQPFRFEAPDSDVRDGSFRVSAFDEIPDGSVAFDIRGAGLDEMEAGDFDKVVIAVDVLREFLDAANEMQAAFETGGEADAENDAGAAEDG